MGTKTNFYSVKIYTTTRKGNDNIHAEFICSFEGDKNELWDTLSKQYKPLFVSVNEIKEIKKVDKVEKAIESKNDTSNEQTKSKTFGEYDNGSFYTTRWAGFDLCDKELKESYDTKKEEIEKIETQIIEQIKLRYMNQYGFLIQNVYIQSLFTEFNNQIKVLVKLKDQVQQLFKEQPK